MTPQESQQFQRPATTANIAAGGKVCPVCFREKLEEFVPMLVLDEDLQKLILANAPDTREFQAVCARCVRLFERAKDHIVKDAAMQKDGSHVLSTPLRLDADDRFTGRGVTIAFLDSGFYPHVDLTSPSNRIVGYRNLLDADGELGSLFQPDVASWHGMMTSVVAAGNGSLSNGFYRGIAQDADVVLVKLAAHRTDHRGEYSGRSRMGVGESCKVPNPHRQHFRWRRLRTKLFARSVVADGREMRRRRNHRRLRRRQRRDICRIILFFRPPARRRA